MILEDFLILVGVFAQIGLTGYWIKRVLFYEELIDPRLSTNQWREVILLFVSALVSYFITLMGSYSQVFIKTNHELNIYFQLLTFGSILISMVILFLGVELAAYIQRVGNKNKAYKPA